MNVRWGRLAAAVPAILMVGALVAPAVADQRSRGTNSGSESTGASSRDQLIAPYVERNNQIQNDIKQALHALQLSEAEMQRVFDQIDGFVRSYARFALADPSAYEDATIQRYLDSKLIPMLHEQRLSAQADWIAAGVVESVWNLVVIEQLTAEMANTSAGASEQVGGGN